MKKEKKKSSARGSTLVLFDRFLYFIVVLVIAGISFIGYSEYRNSQDQSYWRDLRREQVFDYKEIQFQDEYTIGEDVQFNSQAVFLGGINLRFNDVLRCRADNEQAYVFFSSYDSSVTTGDKKTEYSSDQWWKYNAITPMDPRECVLDATITAITPFGYQHVQSLRAGPFNFVEAE